ncbi:MAG: hypothetical protein ACXWXS_04675 [Actinomycetota bacterium]
MGLRSRSVLVMLAAIIVVGTACTGDGTPTDSSSSSPSSTVPTGPVKVVKGEFELEHVGVVVHLSWAGTEGTMTIDNGSDLTLEDPRLYVITQDATRIDVEMPATSALAPGEQEELQLTFPIPLEEMGLTVLEFGEESWGLFKPVVEPA